MLSPIQYLYMHTMTWHYQLSDPWWLMSSFPKSIYLTLYLLLQIFKPDMKTNHQSGIQSLSTLAQNLTDRRAACRILLVYLLKIHYRFALLEDFTFMCDHQNHETGEHPSDHCPPWSSQLVLAVSSALVLVMTLLRGHVQSPSIPMLMRPSSPLSHSIPLRFIISSRSKAGICVELLW